MRNRNFLLFCQNAGTKCRLLLESFSARVRPIAGRSNRDWTMPYQFNSDLPLSVRAHLPEHAQDIYRAAFNNSFESYSGSPKQEEIAHRVAWAAVKRRYVKRGEIWVRL
jgi:cation transport regulator